MPPAPVLLASDVDGTFWSEGVSLRMLREAFAARPAGIEVLFVSSRSVDELASLTRVLGAPAEFIAENGAITVTSDVGTSVHLPGARAEPIGRDYAYVTPAHGSALFITAAARTARWRCGASVRLVDELSPAERATLLGDAATVAEATARRASVLVHADWQRESTAHWADALREDGYRVSAGGRWTLVWQGPDKGEALRAYVAARAAAGRPVALVAAAGDAENDMELLSAAQRRFAIPDADGRVSDALRRVPDVEIAPLPGTRGWQSVVAALGRRR